MRGRGRGPVTVDPTEKKRSSIKRLMKIIKRGEEKVPQKGKGKVKKAGTANLRRELPRKSREGL